MRSLISWWVSPLCFFVTKLCWFSSHRVWISIREARHVMDWPLLMVCQKQHVALIKKGWNRLDLCHCWCFKWQLHGWSRNCYAGMQTHPISVSKWVSNIKEVITTTKWPKLAEGAIRGPKLAIFNILFGLCAPQFLSSNFLHNMNVSYQNSSYRAPIS